MSQHLNELWFVSVIHLYINCSLTEMFGRLSLNRYLTDNGLSARQNSAMLITNFFLILTIRTIYGFQFNLFSHFNFVSFICVFVITFCQVYHICSASIFNRKMKWNSFQRKVHWMLKKLRVNVSKLISPPVLTNGKCLQTTFAHHRF